MVNPITMIKNILFIGIQLFFLSASAQHRADNWLFGINAGIDFSSGTPVIRYDGATNTTEGISTISDSSGNLLFYSDGITVWNRLHQVMPNGNGLLGGISSQGALIVPDPASSQQYYLFSLDAVSGSNGFRYSIIDMSQDSGRGDVVQHDVLIRNGLTEKLTAVSNAQNDGYWISVHEFGTDSFYTYSLIPPGFDTIPVISATGIRYDLAQMQNAYGQMKFSPCGNRIASAAGYLDTVDVLDFDNSTGIISNSISIPMPGHVFGIEFSPDGNKIYVSADAPATLYQVDLTSGIADTIIASRLALGISTDTYGLQLAPDGKIYVVKSFSPHLGAITDPDIAGPSCHYVDAAFSVDSAGLGHSPGLCLPEFVQSFFSQSLCSTVSVDETKHERMNLFPNPFHDNFTITPCSDIREILIYSIDGKIKKRINAESISIKTGEDLSPGIYFIAVKTIFGNYISKVIKM
jgi:hypothetical protein